MSLWMITMRTLWRRKRLSILLACLVALSSIAAVVLCGIADRQEAALEYTIDNTVVSCVVTDAKGTNQDSLHMVNGFVDRLLGLRHEQGNYLDEVVCNVRAKSTVALESPKEWNAVGILSQASEHTLSPIEGGSITFFEGWDESVFLTDQRVCLVPDGMNYAQEDGIGYFSISTEDYHLRLQVIGTYVGGGANCIYCPFYMSWEDGLSTLRWVDSCSFDIRDNRRIDEAKAMLFETFVVPDRNNQLDMLSYGLLVQDETFQNTLNEIQSNLSTLRLLLPLLIVLCGGIGFFANYLSTRSRIKEFAVMRCLGMKRRRIFVLAFGENLLLALAGGVIGLLAGGIVNGGLNAVSLACGAGLTAAFLLGTALSVWRITCVNVMKLMKVEG